MISSELLDERRIFGKHSDPFSSISKWVGIWTFPVFSWNIFEYIPRECVGWSQILRIRSINVAARDFDCCSFIRSILYGVEQIYKFGLFIKVHKKSSAFFIHGIHRQSILSHLLLLLNYLFCWLCCSFQLTTKEVSFSTNGVHNDIDN